MPALKRDVVSAAPPTSRPITHQGRSPGQDPRGLLMWGPRIEVEIGPPLLCGSANPRSSGAGPSGAGRYLRMPALMDTGASRTVLTPAAVTRAGLLQVDVTRIARAGGTEDAGVYAASIQFPRYKLATVEVANVICCELPEQPIQCLLGRDILSRWLFTYDGRTGEWTIHE